MNHKISIIIPTYNTIDVISRTLNSVEDQTYKNYEVILVNDGSTDGTKEYLENYKQHKDNVIVYHQDNQGVSFARNKGLDLATGEFVCFLDSDDTYKPTFLEEMLTAILADDCEAVYCNYITIRKGKLIVPSDICFSSSHLQSFLMGGEGLLFRHECLLLNREALLSHSIRFSIAHSIGEDMLFIVTVLTRMRVHCLNKRLCTYIYRENSTMNIDKKNASDRDYKDLQSYFAMKKEIEFSYCDHDKTKVLESINKHINIKLLHACRRLFISFNHHKLKQLNEQIDYNLLGKQKLNRQCKRIIFFLKGKIHYMLGSIYYRWLRI